MDRTLAALDVERPDAALLDVALADGHSTPVATVLTASGVPFAVLAGFKDADLGLALSTSPRLAQPFGSKALKGVMLRLLVEGRSEGPQPLSGKGRSCRLASDKQRA